MKHKKNYFEKKTKERNNNFFGAADRIILYMCVACVYNEIV